MVNDQRLVELLETGSVNDCVAFFRGMPEARRRELAPQCVQRAKALKSKRVVQEDESWFRVNDRLPTATAAVYCTGTLAELKRASWAWFHDRDAIYEILADRRPGWIDEWVRMVLDDSHYWARWRPVRRLVRDGIASKPAHPRYFLGMIGGLVSRFDRDMSLRDELLKDPGLLDDELWHLFEYDGEGENSLAVVDRRDDKGWAQVLIGFVKEGRLSRERLLDSTLAALGRDFNHFRARWFAEFYDALQPTAAEVTQHAERLFDLLRASAPNIVSWAFNKIVPLADQGLFPVDRLTGALQPVLRAKAKTTVKRALRVLAAAAKRHPQAICPIAITASEALAHENPEVQLAAIKLLDSLGAAQQPPVQARIRKYADRVAPSVKKPLGKLIEIRQLTSAVGAGEAANTKPQAEQTKPVRPVRAPARPWKWNLPSDWMRAESDCGRSIASRLSGVQPPWRFPPRCSTAPTSGGWPMPIVSPPSTISRNYSQSARAWSRTRRWWMTRNGASTDSRDYAAASPNTSNGAWLHCSDEFTSCWPAKPGHSSVWDHGMTCAARSSLSAREPSSAYGARTIRKSNCLA